MQAGTKPRKKQKKPQFASQLDRQYHLLWKRKVFAETRLVVVPLVIDVAVTSHLVDTNVRLEDPCNWNAATQKHGKYDASFKDTQYTFSAMVFERWEQSTMKVRKCFASYFASQSSALVASLLLIVSLGSSVVQSAMVCFASREFDGNLADVCLIVP